MKLNLSQKIALVCLVLGIICLSFFTPSEIPKVHAASETAWQITNLTNISITTTRSTVADGWRHVVKNQTGLTSYGRTSDNANTYTDLSTTGGAESVRIDETYRTENFNIQAGDTLTLTSTDGTPTTLTVYLPALSGSTNSTLYVADDGSTYYDSALTNLAYGAPVEVGVSLDSTSAYDFSVANGSLLPNQTYTSANNVRTVTITCNNSSGWKLYTKATGNFVSGSYTINIGNLEWSQNDLSPSWTDMSTTDTQVYASNDPTNYSGTTVGMEYRINIPWGNTGADNYSVKITYTTVVQ